MHVKSMSLVVAALAASLYGCGDSNVFSSMADDSTNSAKTQQGLDALNSGDYQEAVTTFEALNQSNPNDPELTKYLASAYVGSAGFDVLDLVNTLAEADEADSSDNRDMFETIGDLFGADENGLIPELESKIGLVNNAVTLLAPGGTANTEQEFQAGLYAAVQAVLVTSDILGGKNPNDLGGSDIDALVGANYAQPSAVEGQSNAELLNASLAITSQTRDSLLEGLAVGEDQNDLGEDFDEFLTDVNYNDDNNVSAEDLANYLR